MGSRWTLRTRAPASLGHPRDCYLIALVAGATDLGDAEWGTAGLNMAVGATVGILMVLITEEGFFRGWLWASLERAGLGRGGVLLWSSVAFSLWHVSVVTLDTGFDLPAAQIPVYLINVVVIGAIWGLMRQASGSAGRSLCTRPRQQRRPIVSPGSSAHNPKRSSPSGRSPLSPLSHLSHLSP